MSVLQQKLPGTLVVASHNTGKLREIGDLIRPFGLMAKSVADFGLPEPVETGTTFEENALIKAQTACEATGLACLSDDSGLCVDALNGAPGVYTADWAEQPDGSRDFGLAMEKVENALATAGALAPAQRHAKFVSVLCLCLPDGDTHYFRGEAPGTLIWPPQGDQGFGYDPVFMPDGYNITFGEMSATQKHSWVPGEGDGLSHRARAFAKFARACLETAE